MSAAFVKHCFQLVKQVLQLKGFFPLCVWLPQLSGVSQINIHLSSKFLYKCEVLEILSFSGIFGLVEYKHVQ